MDEVFENEIWDSFPAQDEERDEDICPICERGHPIEGFCYNCMNEV